MEANQLFMATADERITASFTQVNQFVSENGRVPQSGKCFRQHQLYARRNGMRDGDDKKQALV